MVRPASMQDWAQAVAIAGLVSGTVLWFARALREDLPVVQAEEDDVRDRELVGSASVGAGHS